MALFSQTPSEEERLLMEIAAKMREQEAANKREQEKARTPAGSAPEAKGAGLVVPAAPAGAAPFYEKGVTTVETNVAPVDVKHRAELLNEVNDNRGAEDQTKLYSFSQQKEGLDDINAELKALKAKPAPKMDPLIPLLYGAQWLASPSGTPADIVGAYKESVASKTREETILRDKIEKLQALKQKQELGLTDADIAYLKAWIPQVAQGKTTTNEAGGYKPKSQGNPNAMPASARAIRDVQKDFNSKIEKFNQSLSFADSVDEMVRNTGPGQVLTAKAIEPLLARASSEVGNLNVYEQQGKTEARDIFSRLQQTVSTLADSKMTDSNRAAVLDLAAQYRKIAKAAIATQRQISAESGAAAYGGIIPDARNKFQKALPARDQAQGGASKPVVSESDKKAVEWVTKNPNDPRAEKIKAVLKSKGLIQ